MPFVSYAQNREDVLLHRVFGGQDSGFYIDIGAWHPVSDSVTKALYDRGWCGINVEPGPIFEELAAARPRDVSLQMAVLERTGETKFFQNLRATGMSRTDAAATDQFETTTVPCETLENIVRNYSSSRPIDFIKIDVEGAEFAIISSTDWRVVRPKILIIESTFPMSTVICNQDWEPLLLDQGYCRAYFDGINCFYVREEDRDALAPHFVVPVNVLDGVVTYDPVAEAEIAHWREVAETMQTERDGFWADMTKTQADLTSTQADLARREREWHLSRVALEQEQRDELGRREHEWNRSRIALGQEQQAELGRREHEWNLSRIALEQEQQRAGAAYDRERAIREEEHREEIASASARERTMMALITAAAERRAKGLRRRQGRVAFFAKDRSRISGHVDSLFHGVIEGWASGDRADPPCTIQAVVGGAIIGVARASRFRQDLVDAGYGDGRKGFEIVLDDDPELAGSFQGKELRIEVQASPPYVLAVFDLPAGEQYGNVVSRCSPSSVHGVDKSLDVPDRRPEEIARHPPVNAATSDAAGTDLGFDRTMTPLGRGILKQLRSKSI